jgi:hypothetical protein
MIGYFQSVMKLQGRWLRGLEIWLEFISELMTLGGMQRPSQVVPVFHLKL